MPTTGKTPEERYPWTGSDLVRVTPSRVRVGQLIAAAGIGDGRYFGRRVTSVSKEEQVDPIWHSTVYRIEYRNPDGTEGHISQPEHLHMWIIKG